MIGRLDVRKIRLPGIRLLGKVSTKILRKFLSLYVKFFTLQKSLNLKILCDIALDFICMVKFKTLIVDFLL